MTHGIRCEVAACAAAIALVVLSGERAGAERQPRTTLQCEASADGELSLVARGVPIMQALEAAADEAGFEVIVADPGVKRPLLTATVPMAPLEDFLHALLHDRNYALLYDGDTETVTTVILLEPSSPSRAAPARRPPAKAKKKSRSGKAPAGAMVVVN